MADRRTLLRGLAALPFAAAPAVSVSASALAGSADPFTTYHQRILALHEAINAGLSDDAADPLFDAWGAIDHEALTGRPTTLAGATGALEYARREFVQFEMEDEEETDNPSHRLILHLVDGALGVFPILTAIINAPTLRPDGSLLDVPGYDDATGLFFDPRGIDFPKIPESPTRQDAERALADLLDLLAGFPFETADGLAVELSAILTACVRQGLPTAPMHGFSAPTAGSGKGKLVDIPSVIATGREAGVIPQCASEEEMEKRIDAELLEGAGAIAIDNCTHPIDGNKLCSMLTQATVSIRPLGGSKRVTVPTSVFLSCTGNNLVVQGDMTRRVVVARLDAGVERPELREFDFEPVAKAKAERVRYVAAALTILRAYKAAGSPPQSKPLGSFEKWSRLVRDALLWLGCGDPVATMEAARGLDPKLSELAEVLAHWKAALGTDRITVRRIIEKATRSSVDGYGNTSREFEHPDMREALMAVAGQGGVINGRRLGKWLAGQAGRIVGGLSIEQCGMDHDNVVSWRVIDRSKKAPSRMAQPHEEDDAHVIPF